MNMQFYQLECQILENMSVIVISTTCHKFGMQTMYHILQQSSSFIDLEGKGKVVPVLN
jgi:hypothetical protein